MKQDSTSTAAAVRQDLLGFTARVSLINVRVRQHVETVEPAPARRECERAPAYLASLETGVKPTSTTVKITQCACTDSASTCLTILGACVKKATPVTDVTWR